MPLDLMGRVRQQKVYKNQTVALSDRIEGWSKSDLTYNGRLTAAR